MKKRRFLSKLDLAVLRALGRRRSGAMWVQRGTTGERNVAWKSPGTKRCPMCRPYDIPEDRCFHPEVPDFSRNPAALKLELEDRRMDFSMLNMSGVWHVRVAARGQLLGGHDGYWTDKSEGKALCFALVAKPRRMGA